MHSHADAHGQCGCLALSSAVATAAAHMTCAGECFAVCSKPAFVLLAVCCCRTCHIRAWMEQARPLCSTGCKLTAASSPQNQPLASTPSRQVTSPWGVTVAERLSVDHIIADRVVAQARTSAARACASHAALCCQTELAVFGTCLELACASSVCVCMQAHVSRHAAAQHRTCTDT
jgi:hypothetical protein